jgi:hypothetical protein
MPILQSAPESRVGTRKGAEKTFTPLDDTFINSQADNRVDSLDPKDARKRKKKLQLSDEHTTSQVPSRKVDNTPTRPSPKPVIRHLPIIINLLPIGPHVTRALPDYTDTPLLAPAQLAIDALVNPLKEPTA